MTITDLPQNCHLITDWIASEKFWLCGVYISDFCPLVKLKSSNKKLGVKRVLRKFHRLNKRGFFDSTFNNASKTIIATN